MSVFLHQTTDRQKVTFLPRTVLSCVIWLSYHLLSLYLINDRIFEEKKVIENKYFSLQLLSETFLIIRRIQRDITKNVRRSSLKVPVILVSS